MKQVNIGPTRSDSEFFESNYPQFIPRITLVLTYHDFSEELLA